MISPNQPIVCVPSTEGRNIAPFDALTNADYYGIVGSAAFLSASKLTFWGGYNGLTVWSLYNSRADSAGAIPLSDNYYSPGYPFNPGYFQMTPWQRFNARATYDGATPASPSVTSACTTAVFNEFYELSELEDTSCEYEIYAETISFIGPPNATVYVDYGIRNECDYALLKFKVSNFTYNTKSVTYGSAIAVGLNRVDITGNGWYSLPIILNPLGAGSSPLPGASPNFFIQSLGPEPYVRFDVDAVEITCFTPDGTDCTDCKTGDYEQPVLLEAIDYWAITETRANADGAIPALSVVPYGPCEAEFKARFDALMAGQNDYNSEMLSVQVDDPYCGQYLYDPLFTDLSTVTSPYAAYGIATTTKYVSAGWAGLLAAFTPNPGPTFNKVVFSSSWCTFSGIPAGIIATYSPTLVSLSAIMNQPNTSYRIKVTTESYAGAYITSGIRVWAQINTNSKVDLGEITAQGTHYFYYRTDSSWNSFAKLLIEGNPGAPFSYALSGLEVSRLVEYTPVLIPSVRLNLTSVFQTIIDSARVSQDFSGAGPFYPIISNALYEYFHFETRTAELNYDPQACFRILITKDYCWDTQDQFRTLPTTPDSLEFCITEPYKWITDPCNTLRIGAGQDTSESKEACAFGFTYPTVSEALGVTEWLHLTRIYGELRNPQYDGESVSYQDSRGKKRIVYVESREFMEMVINFAPKWVHNFLRLACRHDFFYIHDGNTDAYYFTRSETYSPTWIRTRLIAPAFLEVEVKEQDLRKELCCIGFVGQEPGDDQRLPAPDSEYVVYGPPAPGEPGDEEDTIFDLSFDFTFE